MTVHAIRSSYLGALAHTIVGTNGKPVKKPKQRAMALKYERSSQVVTYTVKRLASGSGFHGQRAVGWGQKLKSGHGADSFTAPLLTEIGHG